MWESRSLPSHYGHINHVISRRGRLSFDGPNTRKLNALCRNFYLNWFCSIHASIQNATQDLQNVAPGSIYCSGICRDAMECTGICYSKSIQFLLEYNIVSRDGKDLERPSKCPKTILETDPHIGEKMPRHTLKITDFGACFAHVVACTICVSRHYR